MWATCKEQNWSKQKKFPSAGQSRAHSEMRIHSHSPQREKGEFSTSPVQQDKNKGADELLCFSLCFLSEDPVEFVGVGMYRVGVALFRFFINIPFYSITPKKRRPMFLWDYRYKHPSWRCVESLGAVCREQEHFPWQQTLHAKNSNNDFITALQILNQHGKWKISPHWLSTLNKPASVLCCFSMRPKRHKY